MPIQQAFELFDSLVTPVALYASEFWLPCIMQKKCFSSEQNLLQFWETLKCETINQRLCRMLLSVHGKTSRLAVLGDLGRHPMHVRALQSCLSYRHSLNNKPGNSLVSLAMKEMSVLAGQGKDCWLTRVQSMQRLLRLPTTGHRLYGKKIGRHIKTCFEGTWIEQIKSVKPGSDGVYHNKLRTYNQLK